MKFRKKPVVIEATQWDGELTTALALIALGAQITFPFDKKSTNIVVGTLEDGRLSGGGSQVLQVASKGDWIIKGVKNEFYPCKPDIFAATYEREDES